MKVRKVGTRFIAVIRKLLMITDRGNVILLVTVVVIAIGIVVTTLATIGSGLGFDAGEGRRIVAIDREWDGSITARYVKVNDLRPNSSLPFLDPFGKTMKEFYKVANPNPALLARILQSKDADDYEYYMLIRLPEMYGGKDADDISSYRAYSKIGINMLQKCLVGYRDDEGKQWIEDPCSGDIYRVWDGLAIHGYSAFSSANGSPNALAMLRLGVDADGYIVAFKSDNSVTGDGVPGYGRIISGKDVIENSKAMLDSLMRYFGIGIDMHMFDGYIPTRVGMLWKWIDGMDEGKMQRVDYVWLSHNSINGISGYSLSIFNLERYPILRLEQEHEDTALAIINEDTALAIINLLGYSYEQYPYNCMYERSAWSIDGRYHMLISRGYIAGGSPCLISEHMLFVWLPDDKGEEYLIIINGYMLSREEMIAIASQLT
ncbi:MAG: hypothetical protein QXS98_04540 [Candidatus Nitrosocaldus sp.]